MSALWDRKPPCPYAQEDGERCCECELCHAYSPELAWEALIARSCRLAELERLGR